MPNLCGTLGSRKFRHASAPNSKPGARERRRRREQRLAAERNAELQALLTAGTWDDVDDEDDPFIIALEETPRDPRLSRLSDGEIDALMYDDIKNGNVPRWMQAIVDDPDDSLVY